VDGYVDEPTCLGVPPYLSTYPRYIAGAIWQHSPKTDIIYQTIDSVRESFADAIDLWSTSDILILVAGMVVPGKYIGGTPISVRETKELFSHQDLTAVPKLLAGPWAKFGCGIEGGRAAVSPEELSPPFDYLVKGDTGLVIAALANSGWNFTDTDFTMKGDISNTGELTVRGARLVNQASGFKRGYIICEIETYRGCPRYLTGGCSFCTEPLYGEPNQRPAVQVAKEIEALYAQGVRAFRIGKQADLFVYGSPEMGEEEFPTPNPAAVADLFSKIRAVGPEIETLHIDNVNPGTLARHPTESRSVAKEIMQYHTVGDVAAFGVESLDPVVIKKNNLKATPNQVLDAIKLLNEVGAKREGRSLPHLLPGINLVYGLPGERDQTLEHNLQFLLGILEENLLVRRINIRQMIGFQDTRATQGSAGGVKRNQFFRHKKRVRNLVDVKMLEKVAPKGTVIGLVYLDKYQGKSLLYRPLGTYPLLCHMSNGVKPLDRIEVMVVDHGPRSVSVIPYPFQINNASMSQLESIPGMGSKRAARVKINAPFSNVAELESIMEFDIPDWLRESIDFNES